MEGEKVVVQWDLMCYNGGRSMTINGCVSLVCHKVTRCESVCKQGLLLVVRKSHLEKCSKQVPYPMDFCSLPKLPPCLHTEFILECAQRRCCVVGPVSPGASGQTILGHGSYGRDQKHKAPVSGLLTILECSWYDSM